MSVTVILIPSVKVTGGRQNQNSVACSASAPSSIPAPLLLQSRVTAVDALSAIVTTGAASLLATTTAGPAILSTPLTDDSVMLFILVVP